MLESAWGIIIHPYTGKLLFTTKLGNTKKEAEEAKQKSLWMNEKEIMKAFKIEFAKWQIENNESAYDAALFEIEEEAGAKKENLRLLEDLWHYIKNKKGQEEKKVSMYLFRLLEDQEVYTPTDGRHISDFFSLDEALLLLKKKEQKLFLKQNKDLLTGYIAEIRNTCKKMYTIDQ